MKKVRVFGHTTIIVSTIIEVPDDADEDQIYDKVAEKFAGISAFVGNGGTHKLIGVSGKNDTITVDEPVEFDDFTSIS